MCQQRSFSSLNCNYFPLRLPQEHHNNSLRIKLYTNRSNISIRSLRCRRIAVSAFPSTSDIGSRAMPLYLCQYLLPGVGKFGGSVSPKPFHQRLAFFFQMQQVGSTSYRLWLHVTPRLLEVAETSQSSSASTTNASAVLQKIMSWDQMRAFGSEFVYFRQLRPRAYK